MSLVKFFLGGLVSLALVALVGCTRCGEQPQVTPAFDYSDEMDAHSDMHGMDDDDMDDFDKHHMGLDLDIDEMDEMDMGYDEEDMD